MGDRRHEKGDLRHPHRGLFWRSDQPLHQLDTMVDDDGSTAASDRGGALVERLTDTVDQFGVRAQGVEFLRDGAPP